MAERKGSRRLSREKAFQVLYGLVFVEEAGGQADPLEALDVYPRPEGQDRLRAQTEEYARELVLGVWTQRAKLDEAIGRHSRNWKVSRIARVDLAILRLAMFEMLNRPDVPPKVAINEAVEMAKLYGDHNTPGFVNGILDAAARELEGGKA